MTNRDPARVMSNSVTGGTGPDDPNLARGYYLRPTVVRADPAAAARVLKFANGTYFGRKWPMMSVEHASPLLGTTVVRSLALTLSLRPGALEAGVVGDAFHEYWRQSITQAAAAFGRRTANCEPPEGRLIALTVPPALATSEDTIDSPMPVPGISSLPRANGWKMSTSEGRPGP